MSQQFCLKWSSHMNNMMDVFKNLLSDEAMVDVTLACDGLSLKAHKIVLSACSSFFQSLFLENPCKHPIVILKDMKYAELKAIVDFMYHGEVNVALDELSAFMKAAETLRIKGLAEGTEKKSLTKLKQSSREAVRKSSKRRKVQKRKQTLSDHSDEEISQPESEQSDSPEIEEIFSDMETSTSQYSNAPSSVPVQTVLAHTSNSFVKQYQQQQEQSVDQDAEETFPPDEKFDVEPSKLLEQTLITDDLPGVSGRSSSQPNKFSMDNQKWSRDSKDYSRPSACTSISSDNLIVACQQHENVLVPAPAPAYNKENVPLDIKTEVDVVNVQNILEEFQDEVNIGNGVKVKEWDLKRCSYHSFSKLTTDLMSLLFSREEMATSSLTGKISNAHANQNLEAKPALDPEKVAAIISYVMDKFPAEATYQKIRRIIAYKLKYEAWKKFGRSYTKEKGANEL